MFAFDSFESFCWWMLIICWLIAVGIGQIVKTTVRVVEKAAKNETVQEAGRGALAVWLDWLRGKE